MLSRKPAPKVVTRNDPVSGAVSQLTIADDADDDDDDESGDDTRKTALSLEERKQRAQREREEKQRKYEEVRERLFGSATTAAAGGGAAVGSGTSSPTGTLTPPRAGSRGKNRGARGGDGRPSSSSSASSKMQTRQLYDPSYTVKPDSVYIQKRDAPELPAAQTEEQPVRAPRGPDGSGRGGFGFANRGARPS